MKTESYSLFTEPNDKKVIGSEGVCLRRFSPVKFPDV